MDSPTDQNQGDLHQTLRRVFGFDRFRADQEGIVRAILAGRDVFAVMPTGGGKSLCYQLPACLRSGVCVVISPLISLMKDQVDAARANGLRAAYWNSSLDGGERADVARALQAGELNLLYVSPERFALGGFLDTLKQVHISLLAVDEAHCVSEWGHDFRPDYLTLSDLVDHFPTTPLAAFTATATHRVQEDIVKRLRLRKPHIVRASFDRPNLFYQVEPKTDADTQIAEFLSGRKGQAAIVYRTTRKDVTATADYLAAVGIRALPYHAGMDSAQRQRNQDAFSRDDADVIVATIAFGMGIDKSNVRYVIHADLPKNLEGYYQETGRAGRDGAAAQCLLLFGMADVPTLRFFIRKIEDATEQQVASTKLAQMIDFAESTICRRKRLLGYFGETYSATDCHACDICSGPVRIDDGSVDAQKVMSAIARTDGKFAAERIVQIVLGTDSEELRALGCHTLKTFGVGKDKSETHWHQVLAELLRQGCLEAQEGSTALMMTSVGKDVLFGRRPFCLLQKAKAAGKAKVPHKARLTKAAMVRADDEDAPYDTGLFEALRKWRRQAAQEANVPPFVVMSDRTLQDICRRLPRTLAAMAGVTGIGEAKLRRFGPEIIEEVGVFLAQHGKRSAGSGSPKGKKSR